MKYLNPKAPALKVALDAFNDARLHLSSPKIVSDYHRQLLGKLGAAAETVEKELHDVMLIEPGEEAYFLRSVPGMWDSSNTGLKSGPVIIEDVKMKDGFPFWYGVKTSEKGSSYYRVDAKQLKYMWYQMPLEP